MTDEIKCATETKAGLLPSIPAILFASIFLFLTLMAGDSLLADADTGYHVRAGEYIVDTWKFIRHDIFSFHSPPIPWTAHEWLSEVIMALIHRHAGLTGVVLFFAAIIASTYAALFSSLRRDGGNILPAIVVSLLVVGASQIHWLARPHIFSLLIMVFWYRILEDYKHGRADRLFYLPVMMLFWANLHGGYIVGFIMTAAYVMEFAASAVRSASGQRNFQFNKARRLTIFGASCLAAAIINPQGWRILLFPFGVAGNKFLMNNVHEFLSPNFHEPMIFTWLLLLSVLVISFSKPLDFAEAFLILFFLYMSLYSVRYIPLYGIIAAPIISRKIDSLIPSMGGIGNFLSNMGSRMAENDGKADARLWMLGTLMLAVVLAGSGRTGYSFDPGLKPAAAVDFIKKEKIPGHMFNNDEFGDYLIYSAWPEFRVFFDGRSDMYGEKMIKEYFAVTRLQSDMNDVLKKYDISWMFIDADSSLSRVMLTRPDWKLIYADKISRIFVKDTPQNAELIRKYAHVRPPVEEKKP